MKRSIIPLLSFLSFISAPLQADVDQHITLEHYNELLQSAEVWEERDIEAINVVQDVGGPAELQASIDDEGRLIKPVIECEFIEPKVPKIAGKSAKFECASVQPIGGKKKRKLKVKYDPAKILPRNSPLLPPFGFNGEVYSEVAASRLLRTLGFKADAMYPAKVICLNCPEEPFSYVTRPELRGTMKRVERLEIPAAAIEIKAEGEDLGVPLRNAEGQVVLDEFSEEVYSSVGWGLDAIRSRSTFNAIPREALVMLLGWLQHADNKASNQRLLCVAWNGQSCDSAWLVAQDLGSLLGRGTDVIGDLSNFKRPAMSKFTYGHWSAVPVWKSESTCTIKVNTIPLVDHLAQLDDKNTLENKQFSKEARDFLVDLLEKLSEEQLTQIFTLAQVDQRAEQYKPHFWSTARTIRVSDWVGAFKHKRTQLAAASCQQAGQP